MAKLYIIRGRFLASLEMTAFSGLSGEGSRGVLNKIYSMKKSSCKTPRLPSHPPLNSTLSFRTK
ncbi:MAG TPA: hypothetical protein DDW27_21895 [Bacteroidales bacterium]|nr:hypothetical protein [Bacteroidales bacterium]